MRSFPCTIALVIEGLLVACTAPQGQVCSSGSDCPANNYCLLQQCVQPSTVSQNLSVVVTPSDPALAPQQFLPNQFQTVDGFSTILLDAPQVLAGHVALPANCGNAGYPVHFEFIGATVIPGVGNTFEFDTDEAGNLSAGLPIGSYTERVSTAVACAAPFAQSYAVISGGPSPSSVNVPFDAPFVAGQPLPGTDGGEEDGGSVALSLDIAGQVTFKPPADAGLPDAGLPDAGPPDAGLPIGAAVRILAVTDAGLLGGPRLSGDQPLQLIDGGLWFGLSFVPGGPVALPVPAAVGVISTPNGTKCVPTEGSQIATCDQFIVEIGPSPAVPSLLTTIDLQIDAPEHDGGENAVVTLLNAAPVPSAEVTLPFNPMLTFNLPILALNPDDTTPLPSAAVAIASVDQGIEACPPPDSGVTCHLNADGTTDSNGNLSFPVPPGRYTLTLEPPTPLGSSTTVVDVLDGGELSVVSGAGTLVGDEVELPAVKAVEVKGMVREPSGQPGVLNGPLLPIGEAEMLTAVDLVPVALGPVTNGLFDLEVPPGQYVLLVKPDSSTRFPVFHTQLTIKESLPNQSCPLTEPGLLTGIVEVEIDGGLPVPTQAYLEFYEVTTDADGGVISYPVATAVTDSEGRWSAAGPPAQ